jgi:(E)-4-hydroxy-3-methylbut-2-enyl-diphosphate synthase
MYNEKRFVKMTDKRVSRVLKIGGFKHIKAVMMGGDFPVAVQTMYKDRLKPGDLKNGALIKRIETLDSMGCGLLRFAVPDLETAEVLGHLAEMTSMPLIADIHFDSKTALRCMDFPVAKIRINPGNLGGIEKTRAVLEKAAAKNVPVRIGINAGSLPSDLRGRVEQGLDAAQALALAAQRELAIFEDFNFADYVVSMKASSIADTVRANRVLAKVTDAPLHLGVTEAGPLTAGTVRNTATLVTLLSEGIGDTIRVSLSDTVENEVIAGREIARAAAELAACNNAPYAKRARKGVSIVSCPRCGRHGFDTHGFTARWMPKLYAMDRNITVAVMGCEVNGPQEAKNADLGITGVGDKVLIFKKGKIIRTIAASEADKAFEEELAKYEI